MAVFADVELPVGLILALILFYPFIELLPHYHFNCIIYYYYYLFEIPAFADIAVRDRLILALILFYWFMERHSLHFFYLPLQEWLLLLT